MVYIDNLTMVKFNHRSSHWTDPGSQPKAKATNANANWLQGVQQIADAMGATASTGSGPVFQKSHAHVVRSTHAERPRAPSHQRARPLLCAASLP